MISLGGADSDLFDSLVSAALPNGGLVVTLAEVYIDESGSHDDSPVLSVAGYIFFDKRARRLTRQWKAALDEKSVPYFRMSACAHGNEPLGHLCLKERVELEIRLIDIIKRYSALGFGITVDEKLFREYGITHPEIGGPYSFCLRMVINTVRIWANETGFDGEVAYFFESGHRDQRQANRIMNHIFMDKSLRDRHHYVSHVFADKQKIIPLQASDMLAWHWFTHTKRRMAGNNQPRRDFKRLLKEGRDKVMICNDEMLSGIKEIVDRVGF
jgi:Protein of unknown function (DUF3800)